MNQTNWKKNTHGSIYCITQAQKTLWCSGGSRGGRQERAHPLFWVQFLSFLCSLQRKFGHIIGWRLHVTPHSWFQGIYCTFFANQSSQENLHVIFRIGWFHSSAQWMSHDDNKRREKIPGNSCQGWGYQSPGRQIWCQAWDRQRLPKTCLYDGSQNWSYQF